MSVESSLFDILTQGRPLVRPRIQCLPFLSVKGHLKKSRGFWKQECQLSATLAFEQKRR